MPFQGFRCDATVPLANTVLVDDCRSCAAKGALPGCNMSPSIVSGIANGIREYKKDSISVTELLGCPRKRRLMIEHPYWLSPSKNWAAFRGQLVHAMLDKFSADTPSNFLADVEKRISARFDGVEITGQPDVYYPDLERLDDYKTTRRVPKTGVFKTETRTWICPSTNKIIAQDTKAYRNKYIACSYCDDGKHVAKDCMVVDVQEEYKQAQAYDHHVAQVNIYAWMLAQNNKPVRHASVIYMDMNEVLRVPVQLFSDDQTEHLIRQRLLVHGSRRLPPVLEAEAKWECDYCPVQNICEELVLNQQN